MLTYDVRRTNALAKKSDSETTDIIYPLLYNTTLHYGG